jgi:hypothetical protein
MTNRPVKTPSRGATPSAQSLDQRLRHQGLEPHWWSDGPGDAYAPHEDPHHKVLYCHQGSITFLLPLTGEAVELRAGDRIDLPPGIRHGARVGPAGVCCVEGWRQVE